MGTGVSGGMHSPLHPPLWAQSAAVMWPPARANDTHVARRTAVAVRAPADSGTSDFEDGCDAVPQPGDSTDDDGQPAPPPPQRPAVADPSPAGVLWPVPQDEECVGTEPRRTRVTRGPLQVREHKLLRARQQAATTARVHRQLSSEQIDNGQPEGHGSDPPKNVLNCGFHFGSFGEDARDPQKRADEWNQLKRSPAHILMLTEATDALQEYLAEETPEVGGGLTPSAVQGTEVVESLAKRECKEWLSIKGGEPKTTPLIAVRNTAGESLDLKWFEKKSFGKLKKKQTWSRVLICRVSLDAHVLGLGDEFNVMCIHVHNSLGAATGVSASKLKSYFDWFANLLREHRVQVVCGDFNMLMLPTFEQCRSRGIQVDLAAWNTFKIIPGGKPACDSCAAFFVDVPGSYTLAPGGRLEDLGLIAEAGFRRTDKSNGLYWYHGFRAKDDEGWDGAEAPGYEFDRYAPRDIKDVAAKLRVFLTPSKASADLLETAIVGTKKCQTPDGQYHPTVHQKPTPLAEWQGVTKKQRPGSHLPLLFYAEGACNRSPEKRQERRAKSWTSYKARQGNPAAEENETEEANEVAAPAPEETPRPSFRGAAVAATPPSFPGAAVAATPAAAPAPAGQPRDPQAHPQPQTQQPQPQQHQQEQQPQQQGQLQQQPQPQGGAAAARRAATPAAHLADPELQKLQQALAAAAAAPPPPAAPQPEGQPAAEAPAAAPATAAAAPTAAAAAAGAPQWCPSAPVVQMQMVPVVPVGETGHHQFWDPQIPRPGHDWPPHPETQAAVAASSGSCVAPYHGHGANWAAPHPAQDWPAGWNEQQDQLALPPPLPTPALASPVMHVPMHFSGPDSPQAPIVSIEPAEDRRLVEAQRSDYAQIQAELTAERRHMNVMTAELAEARAENRRLTAQMNAEVAEARAANWRNNSWYNSGRNDGW